MGVGFPGIIRNNVIEESPNLPQLKGSQIGQLLKDALGPRLSNVPVICFNDADILAAGMAATRDHLDRLVRVWTLGNGIGYGPLSAPRGRLGSAGIRWSPSIPRSTSAAAAGWGTWKASWGNGPCACGSWIWSPRKYCQQALGGDQRCIEFVKLWHRALAAGTATSIHLDGPGKFFVTGYNARFVNMTLLSEYVNEMVKLSPLQGYSLEVVTGGEEVAVIGAAVNASRWRGRT